MKYVEYMYTARGPAILRAAVRILIWGNGDLEIPTWLVLVVCIEVTWFPASAIQWYMALQDY